MAPIRRNTAYSLAECPPLPKEVELPASLGDDACSWLDEYINFSRLWSPRSYEGYHTGCGLFTLSTIAARRVMVNFGKPRYTNLSIVLTGRTSINAKSSVAGIAKDVISEVGLGGLLLPDTCTPQSMIEMMSTIPENFDQLTIAQKEEWQTKIAFLGQRGWYYEEFGGLMAAMMKKDGVMAEFKSILRRFDDCEEKIDYSTVGRGYRMIANPYLSMLGLLPPAELKPYARKGASLWHDGFLARIQFIVAPSDYMRDGRFPKGERVLPASLLDPLKIWHDRLGIPKWRLSGRGANYEPFNPKPIDISNEVEDALYAYDNALRHILLQSPYHDLDGNYSRIAEKALRIALLFASLNNEPQIQMNHWARAQQIVEDSRKDLHTLYSQLQDDNISETARPLIKTDEEKVLGAIDRKVAPTKREIMQLTDLDATQASAVLTPLINRGIIEEQPDGKTTRYVRIQAPEMQEPDGLF